MTFFRHKLSAELTESHLIRTSKREVEQKTCSKLFAKPGLNYDLTKPELMQNGANNCKHLGTDFPRTFILVEASSSIINVTG